MKRSKSFTLNDWPIIRVSCLHIIRLLRRKFCAFRFFCKPSTVVQGEPTRRERLKSALYLRLKKRKTFFRKENWKFLKLFLSENVA